MANYAKGIFIKKGKFSIKLSVKVTDFIQWLKENENEKGYVNTEIKERKEPGKYGDTHYMTLDEWKPEKKEEVLKGNDIEEQDKVPTGQDLPF